MSGAHAASEAAPASAPAAASEAPVLEARGLVKRYGRVTALNGADFELRRGEILAVIGDNGAGKTSLVRALTGSLALDHGEILMDGAPVRWHSPLEARRSGIETVHQTLALAPSMNIADNLFMGRELRRRGWTGRLGILDHASMRREARRLLDELGLLTIQNIDQTVETLSGGQRQGIAVARAVAFGGRVVIMDEPTAALGVKESRRVLDLIIGVRERGLSVVLVSHNMPHVWEVSDRIHIHRLGERAAIVSPATHSMSQGVALMTGAA